MTKLIKKILYTGTITLKTGLHIGGANTALNIGGPDKFVVRNPLDKKPYIPGSSLKGKLRSLLELKYGQIGEDGGACQRPQSPSGQLFGVAADIEGGHASRLIVRDCMMKNADNFKNTDLFYTESKTEANIDRVTSAANPRTYERVPAGAEFELNMILNIFDCDVKPDNNTDNENGDSDKSSKYNEKDVEKTEERLYNYLKEAIELLQDDYLGGSGSRGYGQVDIKLEEPKKKTYND